MCWGIEIKDVFVLEISETGKSKVQFYTSPCFPFFVGCGWLWSWGSLIIEETLASVDFYFDVAFVNKSED